MTAFFCVVFSCSGRGLAMGRSPEQAQEKDQGRPLVNTAMNFEVP